MRNIKRFLSLVPALTLWLMFSVLLWGFVFSRITDTVPQKKLTLCVDAAVPRATELAVELEKTKGEGIRMVKVRPFSYAMFDGDVLRNADLFIVKASDIEAYRDWFAPLPDALRGNAALTLDGEPYGLPAYDATTGKGIATDYITYFATAETPENCYLLFGRKSTHLLSNEDAVDDAAVDFARSLLAI